MALFGCALLPGSLRAQGNFVYTNDDVPSVGANTVSGFSVASNGTLTPVPGSPFATRGTGIADGALSASNHVTVDSADNFLFASNTGSNDVSVFSINAGTGTLSLVAGSPFATGGGGGVGISLSSTPDGRFLMAANGGSNNLTVFSIASSGTLTPIAGSPFPALSFPEGIKVSPDGKFLAVAEPFLNQVEMFSIASTGSLTSLGAFPGGSVGELAGVDINCATSLLYGGEFNFGKTIVDGYSIASSGTLTPVPGSPFIPGVGLDSRVVLLSPDDKTLFVSNGFSTFSNTITVFSAASNGSLSLVAGSPFPMNPGASGPLGTATRQDGSLLYVASFFSNSISVFSVASNGALTEVAGSPFPTGQPGGLLSLAAFPSKACRPAAVHVFVDIKPQSCPNPINVGATGTLPVAILGTATFDVTTVDPSSVKLQGVPALRSALEDVATPFTGSLVSATSCTTAGPDGFADLVLSFDDSAVSAALGTVTNGQVLVLTLTGNLKSQFGGTPITGQDVVVIKQ